MHQDSLIEILQELGFTQYEAQCYLGLLRQHPLNGSQLSTVSGVPRSMVYQTLGRLEEKAAVVRLSSEAGEQDCPPCYVPGGIRPQSPLPEITSGSIPESSDPSRIRLLRRG